MASSRTPPPQKKTRKLGLGFNFIAFRRTGVESFIIGLPITVITIAIVLFVWMHFGHIYLLYVSLQQNKKQSPSLNSEWNGSRIYNSVCVILIVELDGHHR